MKIPNKKPEGLQMLGTKNHTGGYMNRQEHLEWCKKRALEYVDTGDSQGAYTSFMSDMNKHEETRGHSALELGMQLLFGGHVNTSEEMRKFIEGFN